MHYFEERVIAIANKFAVEFHDRAPPQVMNPIFFFEFTDSGRHISKELTDVLRRFADLGRILREILENRPQVDERAPVHVTHVHEQQVFFEVIEERIVTRKEEI